METGIEIGLPHRGPDGALCTPLGVVDLTTFQVVDGRLRARDDPLVGTWVGAYPQINLSAVVYRDLGTGEVLARPASEWCDMFTPFKITRRGTHGGLAALIGQWPGDETDEEIAKMVEDLS